MKIFVRALPVIDIIKDLSKQFKVQIETDGVEHLIYLPVHIGKGFIRGSSFSSGIGIIEYECTFFKDTELHFSLNKKHPLKFIFCSKGRLQHTFEKDDDYHVLETYQNIIVSSSGHNGHVLYFKANETTSVTSIEIIRQKFNRRDGYTFAGLDPVLRNIFQDAIAEKSFYYRGNYSMKAADIVEEIRSKVTKGFLRAIFLEGKCFEMLLLQIEQYQDDQDDDKLPQILRRSDVEKVKYIVTLIKDNLGKNYSVDELAKEAGININKLQDGFKFMFGLTINKYMQQVKLEAAKEMLISSDYNISQIVNYIGLNNRSYFSKVFKERYGVSPKYFLKPRKDTPE